MKKNLNNPGEDLSEKLDQKQKIEELKDVVSTKINNSVGFAEAINFIEKGNLIVINWQEELLVKEKIPEIPELVKKYLEMESSDRTKAEWKNFKFKITEKSNSVSGHWIAYLNSICIDYKDKNIYNSWMMQYRWAYANDIDDWDLQIFNPILLEENKQVAIFGFKTWEWNVKILKINKNKKKEYIDTFNVREYEKTKEKIKTIKNAINDPKAKKEFISRDLGTKWNIQDSASFENDNITLELAWHADRDYDAIDDKYMFYAWIKWVGIGKSNKYYAHATHPDDRFYRCKVYIKDAQIIWRWLLQDWIEFIKIKVSVAERKWSEERIMTMVFASNKEFGEKLKFENEVYSQMEKCVNNHQHNHPLFKPTKITEKIIDSDKKVAVWILFEQIDTDRNTSDGEWWLGDQFRYSLWIKKDKEEASQIFEDHAYIRPRSINQLTWTRWRNPIIKNLKIEGNKIKIICSKWENIEKQEWEEKYFNI